MFCAIKIFCDKKYCLTKNEFAQKVIEKYVRRFGELYELSSVGYNIHNLLHLSADVIKFGSLDSYSAFKFENYMQTIKALIKKQNQPLQQLHNRLYEINNCLPTTSEDLEPYANVSHGLLEGYRDLVYKKTKYSVQPPDNYCLIQGKVFKINKIFEQNMDIHISGHFVTNIKEFFVEPCSSLDLNISIVDFETLENETHTYKIEAIESKLMSLKVNGPQLFIPLM